MKSCISVINSGSSSIKFSLYDKIEEQELRLLYSGQIEGIGVAPYFKAKDGKGAVVGELEWENRPTSNHEKFLNFLIDWIRQHRKQKGLKLAGVGHRVVHGGEMYSDPVLVDEKVLSTLEKFNPLAPLHQPHNLATIRAIANIDRSINQVACFDTAFHRTNPEVAQQFALPRELTEEGIRRYGFHGLSYEFIARSFKSIAPKIASGRVIVAHLGSGASMCALANGKSIASSMGFSAMDGLVMGTRPGNLDPGAILYLLEERGLSVQEISTILYKKSGLLGVSGISSDMRELLDSDEPEADEAIDIFLYRINRELGSLTAALGGLDALVFTAGVGENSAPIRARICRDASWLGLKLDRDANNRGKTRISTDDSKVSAWVIPTDEELMVALHTRDLLKFKDD